MVLFTAFYFVAVGITRLVKRTVSGEDVKEKKSNKNNGKKSSYKSLYKD